MARTPSASHRRTFLRTAGLGAVAVLARPGRADAAELTAAEQANVKVVDDMCAAWVAPLDFQKITRFLADDCVYRATETAPPVKGRQAIVETLQKMLGTSKSASFEVVQTFARGPMVVNERIDRFAMPERSLAWTGIGVFFLKNGKIVEWSDYTISMK